MKLRELVAEDVAEDKYRLTVTVSLSEAVGILAGAHFFKPGEAPKPPLVPIIKDAPTAGEEPTQPPPPPERPTAPPKPKPKPAAPPPAAAKAAPPPPPADTAVNGVNGVAGHAAPAPVRREPAKAAPPPAAPAPGLEAAGDIPEPIRNARVMADIIRFLISQGNDTEEKIREACLDWKSRAGDRIPVFTRIDPDALVDRVRNACAAQGIPPN